MEFTEEQLRAIGRRDGSLLVSAGAGTGKTSVLVERFVRSVADDGVDVESILAITFTEKAAAQLAERVRAAFTALGRREDARAAEGAWISTIHGFCARVLRTHALSAGLDPEFRVLDPVETDRLTAGAFDSALGDFLAGGEDPERLRLVAAYTPDRLSQMVLTAYGYLRSQGQGAPELPEVEPPRAAGEREAFADAARAALADLDGVDGQRVAEARDRLVRALELIDRLPADGVAEAEELSELEVKAGAKALKGPACDSYRAATEAYGALCVRHREFLDHVLLRELVRLYGGHYAELKRDRSGLDFNDLELRARDLLKAEVGIREAVTERFSQVMVDEFQDTNPLQNEIFGLITHDNLFRVGDERQSIYRFRHADVEVFRRHRAAAAAEDREERISVNFRSRGEVLDAVDLAFGRLWGDEFDPLRERPGARGAPRGDPTVELLVSDREKRRWDDRFAELIAAGGDPFGAAMRGVTPWRAAEARLLARRVHELTRDDGPFSLGDVVVLLRATTHVAVYERALEERGVGTHVLGGRGYWSQQQVADLRAYLAALANPLDELALVSVLASPLAGLSLDALVLLRGSGRDLWRTVEEIADRQSGPPEGLSEADARAMAAFVARFRTERAGAPRVSLEALIDRAVTSSGYDRAVLALPAGERRMANVRKLMRMAREYESREGRSLRGFIDFVAERDLVQEREGQAPLEGEDMDAVRLMTVHRAKGLEFPVVCVADLGKLGREDDSALRITEDGRVGMRLASMGGGSVPSSDLDAIREEGKRADEEEERRIFYVACTRAQEHLVLSGATDLEQLKPEGPLEEPMRWIWPALAPGIADAGPRFDSQLEYDGRPVRVRCEVVRPADVDALLPPAERDPSPPEHEPVGLGALTAPALAAVPLPPAMPVSRISYSGLESYRRCGYRFYLEKALGLPREDDVVLDPTPAPGGEPPEPPDALPALVRGSLVHELLEQLDFAYPRRPADDEVATLLEANGLPVRGHDVAELADMVERFAGSLLCRRIAAARLARAELPFAFTLDTGGRSLLVNGIVDAHAAEEGGVLVVDYKSDRLGDRDPAAVTEASYSTQRLVYALAALRAGEPRVEVAYCFLERPDEPVSATFTTSDEPALEERLRALAAGVTGGRFEPSDTPHRGLCLGCPGRPALCPWPPDRTLAELPVVG